MGIASLRVIAKNGTEVIYAEDTHVLSEDPGYYSKLLSQLISDGTIECDSIESDVWVMKNEYGQNKYLKFDILQYKYELKAYIIVKKYFFEESHSTLGHKLYYIKNFIKDTQYLNLNAVSSFQQKLKDFDDSTKRNLHSFNEFISFLNEDRFQVFSDAFSGINIPRSKTRKLPKYSSLLLFESLMEKFVHDSSEELRQMFFPIIIWWKLSSVIPMRPIEICLMSKECIHEKDGLFYLTINRFKENHREFTPMDQSKQQTIGITRELYELLVEYRDLVSADDKRETFLSYLFYRNLQLQNGVGGKEKITDVRYFLTKEMNTLLDKFSREVIEDLYNYRVVKKSINPIFKREIEKINLGDTRHLAFCSMMLQGFNPHTIAVMGGHTNINSQMHYSNHMETFVESSVQMLSNSLLNMIDNDTTIQFLEINRLNILKFSVLGDDFYDLPKVPGGRCNSKNIPYDCHVTDCIYCNSFTYDPKEDQVLYEIRRKVNKEIYSKLNFIKATLRNKQHNSVESLENNANSLKTLVNQSAILEAYRLIRK